MIMSILPPPGLENGVPSVPPSIPCTSSECTLDEVAQCSLAQENEYLMRQNAQLRAQMYLMIENCALAQASSLLVEDVRRSSPTAPIIELKLSAHLDIQSDAASTCSGTGTEDSSEANQLENDAAHADQERTSVVMRNIPKVYTRGDLLEFINQQGFDGSYDLVYLPVDFQTELNHGYAFINLTTTENFERFLQHFTNFSNRMNSSDSVCEVSCLEDTAQGIDGMIERYRNSPMMHESVEDRFKPALFENGLRIPFPEPTKKIRAPRRKKVVPPKSD